ncbi:MAG: hypothetical protein OEQ53_04505 [Saprospiraceae bacterium]|nr:hypothetical protein [Saprospiraceae bacterium]
MSSLLKNLKSIFVVEGKDQKAPQTTSGSKEDTKRKRQTPKESQPILSADTGGGSEDGGVVDEKFTDILLRAIEANNQDGFDYIEYKKSLQNLSKMEMDEGTTYKSAYAAAQTMGASPDGLIQSASRYLSVLATEEGKFEAALEKQRSKQIDGGVDRIKQLQAKIDEKQQKIDRLAVEIETHKEELGETELQVKQAGQKVQKTKDNFIASYRQLVAQIQSDIDKIQKYLG